jgi:hypothetical protein
MDDVAKDLIVQLERAEIEASADLYRASSGRLADAVGLSISGLAQGALLLTASGIDVLALNRVVGLGLHGESTQDDLDRLIAALAASGAPRAFVQLAPVDGHERLGSDLERRGLRHYNNWMRLHRALHDLPAASEEGPAVRRIDASRADLFARLVSSAFGYPPALTPIVAQAVGRPGWHHYLASDGERPIGGAAMYVCGPTAWFGFAGTSQEQRRRGAQHALICRRLADAAALGCTHVSIETAEDTVTRDAPSFRNLRRVGFDVAYRRPNYIWERETHTP